MQSFAQNWRGKGEELPGADWLPGGIHADKFMKRPWLAFPVRFGPSLAASMPRVPTCCFGCGFFFRRACSEDQRLLRPANEAEQKNRQLKQSRSKEEQSCP